MRVCEKIFILLLSSFIGIIANPEMPFASDSVAITGISGAVETVISEPVVSEEEAKPSNTVISEPVTVEPAVVETVAVEPVRVEPVAVEPAKVEPVRVEPTPAPVTQPAPVTDNIKIAGRSINLVKVDSTAVDAGDHVNKYGSKFLYGHNTSGVFRALYDVKVGDTFSVTEGGVMTNYRVDVVAIYEKADSYSLNLNGQNVRMGAIAKAKYNDVAYDLSLMTCYGTSYGNGDASHRLVVFASAI